MDEFSSLADNTKSSLYDYTNNTVKQFNSIIAKFTGRKSNFFARKEDSKQDAVQRWYHIIIICLTTDCTKICCPIAPPFIQNV